MTLLQQRHAHNGFADINSARQWFTNANGPFSKGTLKVEADKLFDEFTDKLMVLLKSNGFLW